LMTWEDGEFRVDFAGVGKRETRIRGGTQFALMEAMRRVDEVARIGQTLAMDTQLGVDVACLAARLAELPDDVNGVLRLFDGARPLRAAIDLSASDDLATLGVVQQLIRDGILRPAARPASLQHRVSAPVAAAKAAELVEPRIVQFSPVRGVRRERLRREAEQARAKLAAGEPLRLHHVVELPPRGEPESLGELRRISPAVGAAAKTFTPDAQLARVLALDAGAGRPSPRIALVAATTPPPDVTAESIRRLRQRWPWLLGAAALALAWTLRPQPRTERRDSPWLQAKNAAASTASAGMATGPAGHLDAVGRANDLFRQGKYRAAADEYKKALALQPDAVPVLVSLGDAYLEADQPRNALEPLESAARLEPKSGRAQLLLGTTYHSLGRVGDAVKAYRRYLELEPSSEFANDVKVILANLRPSR
jgi:tetratricopeptide (TPR) repeat protein